LKKFLKSVSRSGPLRVTKRIIIALQYLLPGLSQSLSWAFRKSEDSNFYYDLTDVNYRHLGHFIATATGNSPSEIFGYMDELKNSSRYAEAVAEYRSKNRAQSGTTMQPGRRLGWYALIRAVKPKVVLETGVHQGVGALAICLALEKNAADGHVGSYVGTDINKKAGGLIAELGFSFANVLIGDSIDSINQLTERVDVYISDSDHSVGYELDELNIASLKLSKSAIVISDNAHVTDVLEQWSVGLDRNFLFFGEKPKNHWYPGGGIGLSSPSS
jgi:predicted O-methyltransferase YrrM